MSELAFSLPTPPAAFAPELQSVSTLDATYDQLIGAVAPRIVSLGGNPRSSLNTFTLSGRLRGRDVLTDTDLTPDEIGELLETATRIKRCWKRGEPHAYLPGKTLGMLFQHPSTRTRVAFEAGMAQLGGHAIYLGANDLQMKRGETTADTGRVLSRYVDGLVARVADHGDLLTLAEAATVPVFNGLSDACHPLQALSDLLTLRERFGGLNGLKVAYLGDGNNVARSLLLACAAMGVSVAVAAPNGFQPPAEVITQASWLASAAGATVHLSDDPFSAVKDADAVYTDVHTSMGQPDGAARAVILAPYKVTSE